MKYLKFYLLAVILLTALFFVIKSSSDRKFLRTEWQGSVLYFTEIKNEESCTKAGGWSEINWPLNTIFTCFVSNKTVCDRNGGKLNQTGDFISCVR
jgi:hypothetical protein